MPLTDQEVYLQKTVLLQHLFLGVGETTENKSGKLNFVPINLSAKYKREQIVTFLFACLFDQQYDCS